MFPYLIQGDNIVIVIDGKPHTINKTHITFEQVKNAIKTDNWDQVREIIEPKKVVLNYAQGNVTINGDQFFWRGNVMNNSLTAKMIDMLKEGFSIQPLVQFMDNLMQNPSKQAVDELYLFLEKGQLPITPDGHFLAYKKVRGDYKDCHTGTISNHVGSVVEMERNQVDDRRDNTCSTGLHFCSLEYLNSFSGERTMILKINPRDVVSIPSDYNNTKGRTCRYEVISELNAAPEQAFTHSVQANANNVKIEPKTGSSDFYRGYNDGYNDKAYSGQGNDYNEGFEKGKSHRETGIEERYLFVESQNSPLDPWPFPKTGPMGY